MGWLEEKGEKVRNFLSEPDFYMKPLYENLDIENFISENENFRYIYNNVVKYILDKKNSPEKRIDILYCFCLLTAQYLIIEKKYEYEFRKDNIGEGDFYQIIISYDRDGIIIKDLLIGAIISVFSIRKKQSFENFYWHITGENVNSM